MSYDPAVLSEGTPVGGVFWKIPAEVRTLDRLEVVGGDDQVVDLGATFAPLSVRATDDAGRPLVRASVTFAVTDAGGTGTAFQDGGTVTVTTGADGVATTDRALVAGGVPGGVGITATSGDLTTAFVGTVGTPEPERVEKVGGDGMSAEAGAYFGEPLVARVVSASGAGVGDIPVTYSVQGGTGSRFAASADPGVRVADDGASVTVTSLPGTGAAVTPRLIAGPQPGAFAVRAVADGVPSAVTFDLEVVAGEATGLTIHKGDGQSTAPYEPFASNLQVKVTNSAGEAVQGVGVTFEIQGPTGSLFADSTNSATAITDSSGLAGTTRIIAGDSGTVTVVARIPGGTTVTFSLTVTGSTHLGLNPVTGEAR